ncbi:DUF3800 domain-containing protein [Emticicia sp. TH156]|uniref:DUF3800 domain-containing protein n=1 Tax=Emticicia sp. TH156 TaxID=2067454 RepID=UPI000C75B209|nr:DUF3800 domain-containing protein [Emticicia sp. TH156]PLK42081.1 hypothetical protein C0V77_22770 [Emticicia sp. TH156]
MEYFIWCDESVKKGRYFSNFYGGVLIKSKDLSFVQRKLKKVCEDVGFGNEIKWQKVTEQYLEKYKTVIDAFFDLMEEGKIKMRVMFTQNSNKPLNLSEDQIQDEFFILYYQFFKHAFGFAYSNDTSKTIHLRAYFDALPDKIEKNNRFKEFIKNLENNRQFQLARLRFRKDAITEVDSHKHLPLQMMDVVLGAMAFRLNDMHKEKPIGKKRRGKRTIAKEKLYKHIYARVNKLHKGFNIGVSTGKQTGPEDHWEDAYRHWNFKSSEYELDTSQLKSKKKNSVLPT